jgi:hypothetical protein
MSLLAGLNDEIIDYAKSMPERNAAEDIDFEVWGKGFCEKMVRSVLRLSFYSANACRLG